MRHILFFLLSISLVVVVAEPMNFLFTYTGNQAGEIKLVFTLNDSNLGPFTVFSEFEDYPALTGLLNASLTINSVASGIIEIQNFDQLQAGNGGLSLVTQNAFLGDGSNEIGNVQSALLTGNFGLFSFIITNPKAILEFAQTGETFQLNSVVGFTAVPEPSTCFLLSIFGIIAFIRYRKK